MPRLELLNNNAWGCLSGTGSQNDWQELLVLIHWMLVVHIVYNPIFSESLAPQTPEFTLWANILLMPECERNFYKNCPGIKNHCFHLTFSHIIIATSTAINAYSIKKRVTSRIFDTLKKKQKRNDKSQKQITILRLSSMWLRWLTTSITPPWNAFPST